jgi:hypothetical protein
MINAPLLDGRGNHLPALSAAILIVTVQAANMIVTVQAANMIVGHCRREARNVQ